MLLYLSDVTVQFVCGFFPSTKLCYQGTEVIAAPHLLIGHVDVASFQVRCVLNLRQLLVANHHLWNWLESHGRRTKISEVFPYSE